jgi:hypothetical protein
MGGMIRRISGVSIEPRPADRDSASDGLTLSIDGSGGGVEHRMRGMGRLPMGEMSAMEGEGRRAGGGLDLKDGIVRSEVG